MIKYLTEAVDPSWAKRIKENNPNAYAILYGWQYKNEPEVEIAPEVYMDKSSLDKRLNQIVKDYSVYSLISSKGNRYAKGSDIQFFILYPERITESKSSNSSKVGYRNSEYYGANETGLDSIIRYEIGELGNSDIIDTVLDTFEVSVEEKHILEAALGILENEEYLGDTALDLVVKTLLNIVWKKYPNAKYGLWLCETPDAVERWYDGNKDNILTYRIENEQLISDLGFNDQGCLFVYDKPVGNYNIKAEALREDLVVNRVAIFGSNDKELENVCKKFKNKSRVIRDACEDINGFLAAYLYEKGYTDVYTIRGMFKVDTFDWVALKDFSSKELYLIRKTYSDSSKHSLLKYVESLPTAIQKEFYYIPHTWCELPGGIIIDAAWKMFEPYIKGELSKSHYCHFDLIKDITVYSGYPIKTLRSSKIYGKDYLDEQYNLTESQNKQNDNKVVYKLNDITKRLVQRNPLYSKYRVETVELEPIVTLLMKNTSILGRRPENWGDSFDKFHIKNNKAYWYNDPIRLVKMSDGEYRVLDGNHRLIALYNDGYTLVECLVKDSLTATEIKETLTEDIIKKIKRYYASGKLYESVNYDFGEMFLDLTLLGLTHDVKGVEHLFKSDDKLTNFIRFDLDTDNKVFRVKGFYSSLKGLGGTILNTIFKYLPQDYTVDIENNFNPSFWSHIENKYKDYKFVYSIKESIAGGDNTLQFVKIDSVKQLESYIKHTKVNNPKFDKLAIINMATYDKGSLYGLVSGLFELYAVAFVVENKLGINDNYMALIESLKRGYGRILLNKLISTFNNFWLMVDPGNDKLISYYDGFNLNKVILEAKDSPFNVDTYYYTNIKNTKLFYDVIYDYYAKRKIEEKFEITGMEEDAPLDIKLVCDESKIIEEAYHFGNLEYGRKADKRGIMAGRGTGHFGTGFYTIGSVTDDTDYNGRELWEIDLTKYNLFKPRSNDSGYILHDTLKKLNGLFYQYKYNGYTPNLFKLKPYDLRIKLDDFEYEYGNEGIIKFIDSYFPAYREDIDREINIGRWGAAERVAYDSIEDFEDFIDDLDFVVNLLELIFPKEIGKVENIVWSLLKDNELDDQDNIDSISTLFIKKMGYEGVDVTHLNKAEDGLSGLDNFSYGSVVYDLKPGTYRKIRDKKEK